MSQHDYVIDNASGATVRADINSALAAIQSLNSGTSAPSSTVAGMLWLDTTGGVPYALKVRDAGNNHWLTLGNVTDPGSDGNLELLPGKINLPSSGGIFESDGSTQVLTESGGAVTIQNALFSGTISDTASSTSDTRRLVRVSRSTNTNSVSSTTDGSYHTLFSVDFTATSGRSIVVLANCQISVRANESVWGKIETSTDVFALNHYSDSSTNGHNSSSASFMIAGSTVGTGSSVTYFVNLASNSSPAVTLGGNNNIIFMEFI